MRSKRAALALCDALQLDAFFAVHYAGVLPKHPQVARATITALGRVPKTSIVAQSGLINRDSDRSAEVFR